MRHFFRYDFNCFSYKVEGMPQASDTTATCASKVMSMAVWAANHSNYNTVVAYGSYEGGMQGYNDSTAAGAVAAFLIIRGQHWLMSIGVHNPCNPQHYPVTGRCHSDCGPDCAGCKTPCNASSNVMHPTTAELMVTDYGKPLGQAHTVAGKPNVFAREFEKATVSLDCSSFAAAFTPK
jgi:hypothetical protein